MLENLGLLELACCREGKEWRPFSEFSKEEIKAMAGFLWEEAAKQEEQKGENEDLRLLWTVKEQFHLTFREIHLLFLALLPELDQNFCAGFQYLGEKEGRVTYDLERKILSGTGLCLNSDEEQLLRYSFLERLFLKNTEGGGIHDPLILKPQVVEYLTGFKEKWQMEENYRSWDSLEEEPEAKRAYEKMLRWINKEKSDQPGTVFFLYGPEGIGRLAAAKKLAESQKDSLHFIDQGESREQLEKTLMTAALNRKIAVINTEKADQIEMDNIRCCVGLFSPYIKCICLIGREMPDFSVKENWIPVELKPLTLEEQYTVWKKKGEKYPLVSHSFLRSMANKFKMTPGQITACLQTAEKLAAMKGDRKISEDLLAESAFIVLKGHLNHKAAEVSLSFSWEDLVLPEKQKNKLLQACRQVRWKHKVLEEWDMKSSMAYGTGISMVFAGPPGTGKTMAAQAVARELKMELYKVDLAAVVSKYVGETEKQLKQIFEYGRQSQVILFFDEADVLFGKRTEVKDSGDKYSNMEAAFLLQEMESYDGIVILATNLLQNMDEAFKRRMKTIVDFPFPDQAQRRQIWRKAFPKAMPLDEEIDLDYLAEHFEMTGSSIKSAVYRAAFLAAEDGISVSMKHILLGVREEYEKNTGVMPAEAAGPYKMYLAE